jgi:GGDEF domain-containing protein
MMERETRRAVRAEQGLGVLMLDLDHFKKFNDAIATTQATRFYAKLLDSC